jgi:hypothetical protein
MADAPKTYKVEALKAHSYQGENYEVGDVYDFAPVDNPSGISAEAQLESLANTGFAVRVDRKEVARAQAQEAEKAAKARASGKTSVEPMTTRSRTGRALAKPKARKGKK